MPARLPPMPAVLTQYRNSSPLQLLQPLLRVEQVTGTGPTVSLGTDSMQGHSPRWLRARVMTRVPFSDSNER
jgi:hypothetical protein